MSEARTPSRLRQQNFCNARIYSIGWRARVFLKEGIELTYPWVEAQVKALVKRSSIAVA
jgi:hypothetical protein